MSPAETIITSVVASIVVWGAKEWRDTLKERRKTADTGSVEVRRIEFDAVRTKEDRLDAKSQNLFNQYEKRLTELEADVETLKAELKSERENRKMAEIEADVAHQRASDSDAKLHELKARLCVMELEIQTVSRESASNALLAEDRARHIADLKVRIRGLEEKVKCMETLQPEC